MFTTQRKIQVFVITIIWAFVLFAIDKSLNHAPPTMTHNNYKDKPQILVTFIHFCCSGCYDKFYSATSQFEWLAAAAIEKGSLPAQSETDKQVADVTKDVTAEYNRDAIIYINESKIANLDFMKMDMAFRGFGIDPQQKAGAGLVPGRIVLKNIPHFELIASDLHLCCLLCKTAGETYLKQPVKIKNNMPVDPPIPYWKNIGMLKMPIVDKDHQVITAEYENEADVTAFKLALDKAGFSPQAIKINILK